MASQRNNRTIWVDILRALAILSVVLIHSASPVIYLFNKISLKWWMVANFYESISRVGVPIFVMISGMLLLDESKSESIRTFLQKRFKKILIPFFFWGLVYLFWKHYMHNSDISVWLVVKSFINGSLYDHFWFIYMIIALYLLTPIYRVYVKAASRNNIMYFMSVWFVSISVFPLITKLTGAGVNLYIIVNYSGYFFLGYLLNKIQLSSKMIKIAVWAVVLGFVVTSIGTYLLSLNKLDLYLYDYASPNIIVMACGVFALFTLVQKTKIPDIWIVRKVAIVISEASFGIYFIHVIVLELLNKWLKLSGTAFNPIISIPLTCIVGFTVSLGVIVVFRKIPLVKHIVA